VSPNVPSGAYVERARRRGVWGWVRFSAGAGVVLLIPPAAVLLLSGVTQDLMGEFLAQHWWVVAFSPVSVLPHVVIATVAEIRAERNADREGVSLIVDEAGSTSAGHDLTSSPRPTSPR
jgi:hypothetical protein